MGPTMNKFASAARRIKARLGTFKFDLRANVGLMFALSLVPIMGAVGFGIDYANANRIKANLQTTLDAAALAGSASVAASAATSSNNGNSLNSNSDGVDSTPVVSAYVKANFTAKTGLNPTVTVNTLSSGQVDASASLVVNNQFMKFLGMPTMTVHATSEAVYGTGGTLEVAIVFDTTGSMAGTKITSAAAAASQLVSTLAAVPNAASKVKVGLVPFNYYVNVGTTYAGANWLTSTATVSYSWTGPYTTYNCTIQPTYSSTLTPQTCTSVNDGISSTWDCSYYAQLTPAGGCSTSTTTVTNNYSYPWVGCVGSRDWPMDDSATADKVGPSDTQVPALVAVPWVIYYNTCPQTPLQRLQPMTSANATALQNVINTQLVNVGGETYIPSGLLWGWRVLSPNQPFADGAPYSTTNTKAIVLMTDGANTHAPNYPDHEMQNPNNGATGAATDLANTITQDTCKYIQSAGIKIYAIAFEVTDTNIKSILQNCATNVSYYYDATTIASLQAAFTSIGAQLTALRLSK